MRTECRGEYLMPGMNTWDRKLLRNLYGSVVEQGIWLIRNYQEMRKLCEVQTQQQILKKMEWIRHLGRMDHEKVVKKIYESKPEGRMRLGRPRLR